jgi:hypothetical protein
LGVLALTPVGPVGPGGPAGPVAPGIATLKAYSYWSSILNFKATEANHEINELLHALPQANEQTRDYLKLISPHPRSQTIPVNGDTPPDHAAPTWYTQMEQVGYLEGPNAPRGLTIQEVQDLYAKVKEARNLELRPSTLAWPEAIEILKPSLGLEVLFWWGWQRHNKIWTYRQQGIPREQWRDVDPYLIEWSFCNSFRILDFVSQRVVEISNDDLSKGSFEEQFVRVILLKIFNEWATYCVIRDGLGEEPQRSNFDPARIKSIVNKAREEKRLKRRFRPAYRTGIGIELLDSLKDMLDEEAPKKILANCRNLYQVSAYLQRFNGVGSFFGSQWAIDLAYGPHLGPYPLDGFCLAGPGGMVGLSLCFEPRDWTYREINEAILTLHSCQDECFQLVTQGNAPRLAGRLPCPMDLQNFCCETQKFLPQTAQNAYLGGAGRQSPPTLPVWWHEKDWEEKERAEWVADYQERKRAGNVAATLIERLKRAAQNE